MQELQKAGLSGVLLIKSNFPNNGKWDMQVNHGLPGQVALNNEQTGELLHDITYPDKISTRDQYAFFRGKVRKAGYLSNFVYGYAIGALSTPKGLSDLGAYYANAKSVQIADNPDAIRAMHEGYEAYWKDHPLEKRDWYNY